MLADKCEIVRFFFEHESAFEWSWTPASGVTFSYLPSCCETHIEELKTKLELLVSGDLPEISRKISSFFEIAKPDGELQMVGVIGMLFAENLHATGMLLPLDPSSS